MAYTNLATGVAWGEGYTTLRLSFAYDSKRSAADMLYRLRVTVAAFDGDYYFGYPIYATIKLDGTTYVTGATVKSANPSNWSSDIVYESDWFTVAGKPTGSVVAAITIYSGYGSSRTGTYTYNLPVIQAASTLAADAGTLGAEQTLTITRYDTGFTHTVTASCGSTTKTVVTKSTATSIKYTPPVSFAVAAPNGTTVSVTYTVDTYDGATKIGSTTTIVSYAIPTTVVPSLQVTLSDPTGNKDHYGFYVQGQSTVKVAAAAAGIYGSTIKAYAITVGSQSGTANNAAFPLPTSGTVKITVKITDSRGRTATYTTTISVTAYTSPTVSIDTLYRCDSSGNEAPEGEYAYVNVAYSITSLAGLNTAALSVSYRQNGATTWTTKTITDGTSIVIPAASTKAFDVMATCVDDFVSQQSKIRVVPIAFVHWQIDLDRKSISLGEVIANDHTFAVALETIFRGTVTLEQAPINDTDAVPKSYADAISARMQSGWVDPGEIAANGYTDYAVTFPTAFASKPRVVATFSVRTVSLNYQHLSMVVYGETATGFYIRILNSHATSSFLPTVNWIAILGT